MKLTIFFLRGRTVSHAYATPLNKVYVAGDQRIGTRKAKHSLKRDLNSLVKKKSSGFGGKNSHLQSSSKIATQL